MTGTLWSAEHRAELYRREAAARALHSGQMPYVDGRVGPPRCEGTGLTKPECSCPSCIRELIHAHEGGS